MAYRVRDFIDDPGWVRSFLPELEKTASAITRDAFQHFSDEKFAGIFIDQNHKKYRLFPITDPETTQLSAGYLIYGDTRLRKEATAEVAYRIEKALSNYGFDVPKEISTLSKNASGQMPLLLERATQPPRRKILPFAEGDCALKIAGIARFPIRDKEEAQQAVNYFEENWYDIPPEHRRTFAIGFEKKASIYGVHLGPVGKKYAGVPDPVRIKNALSARGYMNPRLKPLYEKLAEAFPEDPNILAQAIAELDKLAGFDEMWDKGMTDPWAIVFSGDQEKIAARTKHDYEFRIGGDVITGEDLLRLAEQFPKQVENELGVTFGGSFLKDPVGVFDRSGYHMKKILAQLVKKSREIIRGGEV